jgi:malonyl CoA-acyl carrier protein transacylase
MQAFLFPGQGSQVRGMGKGLFDEVGEFTSVESQIDEMLGYSLRRVCLEDSQNQLNETQYTQPCLYVVNALHYYKALGDGLRPQAVAGHSLGEYNALLAAGAYDLLSGLRLVKKRGELMSRARNGGMGAVLGLDANRISSVLIEHGISSLDVANYNASSQTVISGPTDEIKKAAPLLEAAGARTVVQLPVSAAFHSRYMVAAAHEFEEFLGEFSFESLKLPIIANVTGRPYPIDNPTATVRSLLVKQISQSVRWIQSIRYLIDHGYKDFREIGPGTVLTRLVQQIHQAK